MQKFPLKKGLSSAQDLHDEIKEYSELRSFIELCKSAQNQGSRRITVALSELNLKEN